MNKRLAVVLGISPFVAIFVWPYVDKQATTADLKLAVVMHPREEVFVSGFIKNPQASTFSLETLLIEEPGKEPYRKRVSLDADQAFELALGKPKTGTYRASARIRKPQKGQAVQERWLKTPDLVVGDTGSARPQIVRAKDYDYQRLSVFAIIGVAIVGVLLLICVWPRRSARQ